MDYIDRMIATREDSDETQRQLAEQIRYRQPQIARYETRINEPPIRYLIDFCNHYKVSADYILGLPSNYRKPR